MADARTDEARLALYEKYRRQVRTAETILNIAMLAAVVFAFGELLPNLLTGFLSSITLVQGWAPVIALLTAFADMAAVIYAIYKRDWRLTLIVLILTGILIGAGYVSYWGILQPITLGAALIADLLLQPLKKEEGYPHFIIEHEDRAVQEKAIVNTVMRRAVESKVRTTEDRQPGGMHDLLDEDAGQALPAQLFAYKDRSQAAEPAVKPAGEHSGTMDEL